MAGPCMGNGNLSPASLIRLFGSAIGQHLSPTTPARLYIWIWLNPDEKITYVSPNGGNSMLGDGAFRLRHHVLFRSVCAQH